MSDEFVRREVFDEFKKRISDEDHRQNKRIDNCEDAIKLMGELAVQSAKTNQNIESMVKEISKHGERLDELEKVPAETNKQIRNALINTISGGVLGAVITKVLTMF